ncbi:putative damage-inducible protein DinB [Peribacillus deserti]|uniref:Damage-inducible protein DinB n=1 Tax=Peribacillus deserti TaxID=673318 RepID=A0ABS2QEW2_9BACI|nr:DinB family protein [Peribacillus deserti]MBM7691073.1 putative damage-inducible protein DinB [Peribacillus deserti]
MDITPEKSEYAPYYSSYLNLVQDADIFSTLTLQMASMKKECKKLTDKQAAFRYAPQKWSIKEVIGHIADTERIMSFRLLSFARGETTVLPGYDENTYVMEASFHTQSIEDLLENYTAVRYSTLQLLKSLNQEDWLKKGIANSSGVSVRALAAIIAGHELHHRQIIRDRYLESDSFPTT